MNVATLPSSIEIQALLESKGFEAIEVEVYAGRHNPCASAIVIKLSNAKDADDLFHLLDSAPVNVTKTPLPKNAGWSISLTPLSKGGST